MDKKNTNIKIIQSELLGGFNELVHGFSTKVGLSRTFPFYFNLSLSVGDERDKVLENRDVFFRAAGADYRYAATQFQVHGDGISIVEQPGYLGENDAMITSKPNVALTVTSADCVPVFVYDAYRKIIATIHSGWRGTEKKIVKKVLSTLVSDFNCVTSDLYIYLAPSISQDNYEVGDDVAALFDSRYVKPNRDKFLLDVCGCNRDMILEFGVSEDHLEVSDLCSFNEDYLHSYRRDGKKSGRAMGVLMLKG